MGDSDSKEQSKNSDEHPTNDLNNLGEVIKALLGSFGVNVDVSTKTESDGSFEANVDFNTKTESDESDKKSTQEEPMDSENSSKPNASENKENSEESNQTE